MHFADLTEIGDAYAAEEGSQGVRIAALNAVAANLLALRIDLQAARDRTAQQPATGSVAERAAFFRGNSGVAARELAQRQVKEIERKIEAASAKLQRQGAVLMGDGSIDWGQTTRYVVYDHTAAAQGLTQLHPHYDGLLYMDAHHATKFDTENLVTHFGGKGWAIYVMSDTGNIHASSHSVGYRHHSSLLAGANVAGAGEMRVLQGKLVNISNKSGHYAPAAAHLLQVLHVLRKRRVSLMHTHVSFRTATSAQEFSSVDAFLQSLKAAGMETDYDWVKMIRYLEYIPYANFVPLAATKGWRWGTAADFNPALPENMKRGVVRIADATPVSHKEVRAWLKGLGYQLGRTMVMPRVQSGFGR